MIPCVLFAAVAPFLGAVGVQAAADRGIDRTAAEAYFREAEQRSREDGGALWGIPLYGPMLVVDPETREIVANRDDPDGNLTQAGPVWTGTLPESENVANTALDWGGRRWTMLVWPLPEDRDRRANLMMHELFHRVQDDLGFPASSPANAHLDEMPARVWLRLELEALRGALSSEGDEQRAAHERSALVFRAARHRAYEGAATEEAALERNEGLAEYTGGALSGRDPGEIVKYLGEKIDGVETLPTLVRSFAYVTGPAYGILLDRKGKAWRHEIDEKTGLGDVLAREFAITVPEAPEEEAEKLLPRYGGEAIRESERRREQQRQQRLAAYRRQLVDGPVLVIRLQSMQVQFDPRTLQPLGEHGTVYPTLRIADTWGILEVDGAALLSADWTTVSVPAAGVEAGQTGGTVKAEGWTLDLEEGWTVVPGTRPGDLTLRPPSAEVE